MAYQPATVVLNLSASPLDDLLTSVVLRRLDGSSAPLAATTDFVFDAAARTLTLTAARQATLGATDDVEIVYREKR